MTVDPARLSRAADNNSAQPGGATTRIGDQTNMESADFTDLQWRAIALTLEDLTGWGTLHGDLRAFDPHTGAPFDPPIKMVGAYDRRPRAGLPKDWPEVFIRHGWIDLTRLGGGRWVWKPTEAGSTVRERWLPDHLKQGSVIPSL